MISVAINISFSLTENKTSPKRFKLNDFYTNKHFTMK